MNENKEIIVAMAGTVTLNTADYERLVSAKSCLDIIMSYLEQEDSYRLTDVVKAVYRVYKPVITASDSDTNGGEDA